MKTARPFFWQKPLKNIFKKEEQQRAAGFVWSCRYSSTDEPDKQGRWARICHYRGFMIAWVYRIAYENKVVYDVKDYFPSWGYANPCIGSVAETFEEAKAGVERRFREFIEQCK